MYILKKIYIFDNLTGYATPFVKSNLDLIQKPNVRRDKISIPIDRRGRRLIKVSFLTSSKFVERNRLQRGQKEEIRNVNSLQIQAI